MIVFVRTVLSDELDSTVEGGGRKDTTAKPQTVPASTPLPTY